MPICQRCCEATMPTTAYRATLDAYDGSPARSWCCGKNGWRDGIVEEARSTGPASTRSSSAIRFPRRGSSIALRQRERNSPVKNRMRETCTSGSVRGGDGNIPTYSAFGAAQRRERGVEGALLGEGRDVAEEDEAAGRVQSREPFEEEPAEETRQHPHGQEEAGLAGDPARTVRRQAAAGNDDVDVRMVGQRRAPGVEHGGEADARAQMLRVGGDRGQRLRGGPEQQVVDSGLVVERDRADRGRQGGRRDSREPAGALPRGLRAIAARRPPGTWGSDDSGRSCMRRARARSPRSARHVRRARLCDRSRSPT